MTPAEKHRQQKLAAAQGADNPALDAKAANQYELMLMQLAEHRRRLKQVQSIERKAEVKQQLLPLYQPYIDGVLEADAGRQDDVLMTLLVWQIDVGNLEQALRLTRYAIRHQLQTPDRYERSTACLVAEEIADIALKRLGTEEQVASQQLEQALELTAGEDMFDQVRAKLHKALGLTLDAEGNPAQAMAYLQRALELDERSGVKKIIERIERELKKNTTWPAEPA